MSYRRPTSSPSRPPFTPGRLLRWGLLFMALAVFVELVIFGSSVPSSGLKSAAQPTNAADAALNKLQVELPRNKDEAASFDRVHHSPYNFEQVKALNSAFASGNMAQVNKLSQGGPVAATTPGISSSNATGQTQALTPTPTATRDKSFRANAGTPTCFAPPGPVADSCEDDDSPSQATFIIANDVAQIHNLIPNTGTTPELDWLKFSVVTAYTPYTITLNLRTGTVAPSLVLLDPTASSVISTGTGPAAGPIVIGNFIPTIADTFYIRVSPVAGSNYTDEYDIRVVTGTPVATPTPTNTAGSTPTGTPSTCTDTYEFDNDPAHANLIKPSYTDQSSFGGTPGAPPFSETGNSDSQTHFICPTGDVDWVYMDLVKGKPYSISTIQLLNGLDTFIVLYLKDAAGNFVPLYSSDDYPGNGLGSRIDWIVPTSIDTPLGDFVRYYLAVKDVAGHGEDNMRYNLVLTSPGKGLGDCFDAYEPDNNPTQAKEILLNESQSHSICPTGDHDWVKFYAKAGKVYNMSTNFQAASSPGLDTSLYVWQVSFDPNDPGKVVGQGLLAQNDDRSDSDLSSSINFSVPGDGYYYAEFRNAGDIGRNGMYYTVRFTTAAGAPLDVGATQTAAAGAGASSSTQTAVARRTATAIANASATADASSSIIGSLISKMRFSDPGFQRLWTYADLAVADGKVQRSWEWGPYAGANKLEPYAEAAGGSRQVQYFDKARMEINNPKSDHNSKWFVTNGLLVKELVTGWLATGDNQGELHDPARVAVAGDLTDSNNAPTYAAFQKLITLNGANRAESRVGSAVTTSLSKEGNLSDLKGPPEQIKLEVYIKETGHNIPSVFWSYLNAQGVVFDGNNYSQGPVRDWVFSMGLPLSEPFWIKAQVGGVEKDVLVQLFERRVLTYTPSNAPDWRVEMSNVGQHYYLWRYNARLENAN